MLYNEKSMVAHRIVLYNHDSINNHVVNDEQLFITNSFNYTWSYNAPINMLHQQQF